MRYMHPERVEKYGQNYNSLIDAGLTSIVIGARGVDYFHLVASAGGYYLHGRLPGCGPLCRHQQCQPQSLVAECGDLPLTTSTNAAEGCTV